MTESSILIVEDDAPQRALLARFLASQGYVVADVGCVDEARAALLANPPALVLTDHELPDGTGLDVLRAARGVDPDLAVVLITAYGTVGIAVEAMREGAADVLLKPVEPGAPRPTAAIAPPAAPAGREHRAAEAARSSRRRPPAGGRQRGHADPAAARQARRPDGRHGADTGETGTGKEVIARLLQHGAPDPTARS